MIATRNSVCKMRTFKWLMTKTCKSYNYALSFSFGLVEASKLESPMWSTTGKGRGTKATADMNMVCLNHEGEENEKRRKKTLVWWLTQN